MRALRRVIDHVVGLVVCWPRVSIFERVVVSHFAVVRMAQFDCRVRFNMMLTFWVEISALVFESFPTTHFVFDLLLEDISSNDRRVLSPDAIGKLHR